MSQVTSWPTREYNQKPGNEHRADTHSGNIGRWRRRENCRERQRGERDIDRENSSHYLDNAKAAVGGALIEMRPVCQPNRFASYGPA